MNSLNNSDEMTKWLKPFTLRKLWTHQPIFSVFLISKNRWDKPGSITFSSTNSTNYKLSYTRSVKKALKVKNKAKNIDEAHSKVRKNIIQNIILYSGSPSKPKLLSLGPWLKINILNKRIKALPVTIGILYPLHMDLLCRKNSKTIRTTGFMHNQKI